MGSNTYYISLGLIILSVPFLVYGLRVQFGRYKRWYLHEGDPVYSPKEMFYVYIPISLVIVILGIALILPTYELRQAAFFLVDLPLIIATSLLLFWLPNWIKPAWVRWLEKNHGDILLLLLREARITSNWEQRVATQEGLEAWVAEVRHNHGL